jgi:hypothetical protein
MDKRSSRREHAITLRRVTDESRATRLARRLAHAAFALAVLGAAVVPGDAWSPGSPALDRAEVLDAPRIVHAETGLTITPGDGSVDVSTGDGGGSGAIEGLDHAPIRVSAGSFRGVDGWEIGTSSDRPAAWVDDNGVRLDDGMLDRLRVRGWPLPTLLALAAIGAGVVRVRDRARAPVWLPIVLWALAAIALAWPLA